MHNETQIIKQQQQQKDCKWCFSTEEPLILVAPANVIKAGKLALLFGVFIH